MGFFKRAGNFKTACQWLGVYDVIGMPFWIFPPYQKSPNWMILISINFHFLCFSEYKTMLVQAGSFWIPFSLFKTVVQYKQELDPSLELFSNNSRLGSNYRFHIMIDDFSKLHVPFEVCTYLHTKFWKIQEIEYKCCL